MSDKRYTEEFKIAAVRQVSEQGYPVLEVAERLGITNRTLYAWLRKYQLPNPSDAQAEDKDAEIKRLRAELKRTTTERDILKKAAAYFANQPE